MSCRVESTPGACRAFERKAGDIQATFGVPTPRADTFARAILGADPPRSASLVVAGMTRPMYTLGPVIGRAPEPLLVRDTTVHAPAEASGLVLAAALADYAEGWFVPTPGGFAVYLDDDEYVTVFAPKRGAVSRIAGALTAAGFHEVADFTRRFG